MALSQRDQVTGFTLKSAVLEDMDRKLREMKAHDIPSALILCELSGAAAIARSHGQQTEERVIQHASERLMAIAGDKATIGMAGSASFLIFIERASDPMAVLSLAKDITLALGAEAGFDFYEADLPLL